MRDAPRSLTLALAPLIALVACGAEPEEAPSRRASLEVPVTFASMVTKDVVLDRDLISDREWDFALRASADGITIDGNGHALIYTGPLDGTKFHGIKIAGVSNVTIKNFSLIKGFDTGIYISGENNTIENCHIEGNAVAGITGRLTHGLTLRNNTIREPNVGLKLDNADDTSLVGNWLRGGRIGLWREGGSLLEFRGNELEHQSQSTLRGNRRLMRFTSVKREGRVGDRFDFAFEMLTIDGKPAAGSTAVVRTYPLEAITLQHAQHEVTGHFHASRPGLYSIVAEVEDAAGNRATRLARVLVGATASRTTRYFWSDDYPQQGQAPRELLDNGAMHLAPPSKQGHIECGGWVQESAHELPPRPAGVLTRVDFALMMSFVGGADAKPAVGLQWDVTYGGYPEQMKSLPGAWGDGAIAFREVTISGFEHMLDYRNQWRYLGLYFFGWLPYVVTGDPQGYSKTTFHQRVTLSPEVVSVSPESLLLLAASADAADPGSSRLTISGEGAGEIALASFRRPFREARTRLLATGDARVAVEAQRAARSLQSAPLEIEFTAGEVIVEVDAWPDAGSTEGRWSIEAVGRPGPLTHRLMDLAAGAGYRVVANGHELGQWVSDSAGSLSFVYAGSLPVTFGLFPIVVATDAAAVPSDAGVPPGDGHVDQPPPDSQPTTAADIAGAPADAGALESDAGQRAEDAYPATTDSFAAPLDAFATLAESGGPPSENTPPAPSGTEASPASKSLAGGCSFAGTRPLTIWPWILLLLWRASTCGRSSSGPSARRSSTSRR